MPVRRSLDPLGDMSKKNLEVVQKLQHQPLSAFALPYGVVDSAVASAAEETVPEKVFLMVGCTLNLFSGKKSQQSHEAT